MMTLDSTVASLGDVRLTLEDFFRWLRARGRLAPLVREALADRIVEETARRENLSATAEELQAAADTFRRDRGLNGASDTLTWLTARWMSVDDFEAGLETYVLLSKLRQHVPVSAVEARFAAEQTGYERLQLAELCLEREDLARELASQIREEGRDLDTVAGEQRLAVVRRKCCRKDVAGPLSAALTAAKPGQLIGPVATPDGFVLVLVEDLQPAALDADTRGRIANELFEGGLSALLQKAAFHFEPARKS